MSLWQFHAAVNGYNAANTPAEKDELSEAEAEDLFRIVQHAGNRP